jgi:hypothetical protein
VRTIHLFSDFDAWSFGILRAFLRGAQRVDLVATVFTLRHWLDLQGHPRAFAEDGGGLRLLTWPGGASPEALDGLCRLVNIQGALSRGEPREHGQEFFAFGGPRLAVATGAVVATHPGLSENEGGGAIVTHRDLASDPAAQDGVHRFERRSIRRW